jgi:uncharacterized membrane protein
MAVAANVVVLLHRPVPWLGPVAGGLLLFGLPIYLLYSKLDWHWADPSERVGYSLVLTLLLLMGMGLAINGFLPYMGVRRPLEHLPVLFSVDALLVVLALWRRHRWPQVTAFHLPSLGGKDKVVLASCSFIILASIAGAIRLNNGAGGGLTLAMLAVAATLLVFMLAWRDVLNPGVVTTAVYCLAAALLLMTSLRGWYITGHDIQTEFRVFELTKANGNWSMSRLQDPYNACLSITILPTLVAQVMRIADPYVYKLIFQLIFAWCPVLVYKLARRYASMGIALLAVVYFIAFPTFLNDMPFLNRQEMAFLFVAAAFLIVANRNASLTTRRALFAACSLGVVVSHYSTTYVLAGMLVIAWLLGRLAPLSFRPVDATRRRFGLPPLAWSARRAQVVGLANIVFLVGASLLWTGVYTHAIAGLTGTANAVVQSIRGAPESGGSRSPDVSNGLFSLGASSLQKVLHDYRSYALDETRAGRAAGVYYPESLLAQYATPMVSEPSLPVTPLGRDLARAGLNASSFNSVARQVTAKLYQVFLAVGLLAALFSTRRRFAPGRELYALAWGAAIIVVVEVVLPVVSIDYGITRAFLQALILLSLFVAYGTITSFKWLGARWSLALSSAVAIFFFLSLSGVLPQMLGGYPPQLNLNNAGLYYDLYSVHPQQLKAASWLQPLIAGKPGEPRPEVAIDRYTAGRLQAFLGANPQSDIWPAFLTKTAYVYLGFQTVQKGQSAISYEGETVFYKYPIDLLNREKDLIYSSSGVRIYR